MGLIDIAFWFIMLTVFLLFILVIIALIVNQRNYARLRLLTIQRDEALFLLRQKRHQVAEERQALEKQVISMSWAHLRALCESETGTPCTCHTKQDVVDKVFFARRRRATSI